jgi:solute carrier family 40 (iron-regulated transporter), member 1
LQRVVGLIWAYVTHPVFLPSFALSLLYLTVLSFNGQMITYLLAVGVPASVVAMLRGISAVSELSATWIAPKVMARIGTVRGGIWFINYQILWVSAACICLWLPDLLGKSSMPASNLVSGVIVAVVLSRIGLWGFDLCVQIIVQEEVDWASRGAFSSQEFAAQNMFEMLSFASTIVFARPEEFKIPTTVSVCAVAIAGILYAFFVRTRRGHLIHLSTCIDRKGHVGSGVVHLRIPQV